MRTLDAAVAAVATSAREVFVVRLARPCTKDLKPRALPQIVLADWVSGTDPAERIARFGSHRLHLYRLNVRLSWPLRLERGQDSEEIRNQILKPARYITEEQLGTPTTAVSRHFAATRRQRVKRRCEDSLACGGDANGEETIKGK